jgi:hypothetical protein
MRNTIATAREILDEMHLDYKVIETAEWTALEAQADGQPALRIWSADIEADLVIAHTDRWGSPTGRQVRLSNPNRVLAGLAIEAMWAPESTN